MTAEDKTIAKIRARWAREQQDKEIREAHRRQRQQRKRAVDPFRGGAGFPGGPGWAIGVGSGGNSHAAAL